MSLIGSSVDNGPASAEFFEIRIPTRTLPIRIEYAAIRSLHSVMAAQDQSLGLLLGTPSPDGLAVDQCEPLPQATTTNGFLKASSKHPTQRVVGFFRTQASGRPQMQEGDRDIARRCIRPPGSLFLLIQTAAHRPWLAVLFDLEAESVSPAKTPALQFFFDEYLLRNGYSSALIPEPEYQVVVDPPLAGLRSHWAAVAVLGALLLLGVAGYEWFAGKDRGESASISPVASALALKVVRSGNDFEVSWDQLAPALQRASGGSMTIHDGEITRTVALNTTQLREGRILYTPLFGDLSFRLEIEQGARTQAESVQVLSWNANSAPEVLANLESTPLVPIVPALSGRPSSPQSVSRTAAQTRADLRDVTLPDERAPVTATPKETAIGSTPNRDLRSVPALVPQPPGVAFTVPVPPRIEPPPSLDVAPTPASITQPAVTARVVLPPPGGEPTRAATVAPSTSTVPSTATIPVSIPTAAIPAPLKLSYVGPRPIRQVRPPGPPDMPSGVSQVQVRVEIDKSGKVTKVNPVGWTSTNAPLMSRAVRAAWSWLFDPAQLNGQAVPSEMNLDFRF
jgi:hypothetical protein